MDESGGQEAEGSVMRDAEEYENPNPIPDQPIYLRSATGLCYAGSAVDGRYAVERKHRAGMESRRMIRCGCPDCRPMDWCRFTANDGSRCRKKPVAGGYCKDHQDEPEAMGVSGAEDLEFQEG